LSGDFSAQEEVGLATGRQSSALIQRTTTAPLWVGLQADWF